MKKSGFSLLELIVCVGILAVLSAFVMGQFSKSMNSARNANCLANMRALALGFLNCKGNTWLRAGPMVFYNTEMGTAEYQLRPGWLGWYSPSGEYTASLNPMDFEQMGTYYPVGNKEEQKKRLRCLDFGGASKMCAMWNAMKHSQSAYLCPLHVKAVEHQSGGSLRPMWSYVLNGWFMWEPDETPLKNKATAVNDTNGRKGTPNYRPNDMVMCFAELQMSPLKLSRNAPPAIVPAVSAEYSLANDGILQYKGDQAGFISAAGEADALTDGGEIIGFNHTVGNKKVAHVVFLDGHAEQISLPEDAQIENLRDLTAWLCEGLCFTQEGNLFRKDEYDE